MTGRFRRPLARVLDDTSMVPSENLVSPPAAFTHVTTREAAYYYSSGSAREAAGHLPKGTQVASHEISGDFVRVVDGQGLSVFVRGSVLRPL